MLEGIDLSFDAGRVTPAWCAARLAQGQRVLVADLWTGRQRIPAARDALRLWREAGGHTAAYFVVHDGRPAAEHFAEAMAVAGMEWEHLSFVAVDVEVNPTSPSTVRAGCDIVVEHGQRPIIYTSVSKWEQLCSNTDALNDIPLWDASYDLQPSLEMSPPYGGWQRRAGHQYQNTTAIEGIEVCLSIFDDAYLAAIGAIPGVKNDTAARKGLDDIWHVAQMLKTISAHDFARVLEKAVHEVKEFNGWNE